MSNPLRGSRVATLSAYPSAGSSDVALYGIHPDGTGLTQVTSSLHGSKSWLPRWSPDGSKLLFVTFIDGPDQADLWAADADGSNLAQLTHDPGTYESYAWAP